MEKFVIYGAPLYEKQGGKVFKVRVKGGIEFVALKSYTKDRLRSLQHAVPLRCALKHRNIVEFIAWYQTQNHIWVVEELCCGGSLEEVHATDAQLPLATILQFGRDLMDALFFLHTNKVLYCDLRPRNVLVDEFGVLKLSNFEGARQVQSSSAKLWLPLKEALLLQEQQRPHAHFLAPELFSLTPSTDGSGRVLPGVHSFASDFWAFGCVLFQLYFGHLPFAASGTKSEDRDAAEDMTGLIGRICNSDPFAELDLKQRNEESVALSPVPDAAQRDMLLDLLKQLLCKDPRNRIAWPELRKHPFWQSKPPGSSVVADGTVPGGVIGKSDQDVLSLLPDQGAWREFVECLGQLRPNGATLATSGGPGGKTITEHVLLERDQESTIVDTNAVPHGRAEINVPSAVDVTAAATVTLRDPLEDPLQNVDNDECLQKSLPQLLQMLVVIYTRLFASPLAKKHLRAQCERAASLWAQTYGATTVRSDDVLLGGSSMPIIPTEVVQFYAENTLLLCKSDRDIYPVIDPLQLRQSLERNLRWGAIPTTSSEGPPRDVHDVENFSRPDLARFLGFIFDNAIAGDDVHESVAENALNYLAYLAVQSTRLASVLANSSVLEYCIDTMSSSTVAESLLLTAVTLAGAIVGQAGDVRAKDEASQLNSKTSLQLTLSNLLRHRNHAIRLAAAGALGELLFYTCTLDNGTNEGRDHSVEIASRHDWVFPRPVFARLIELLIPRADSRSSAAAAATAQQASSVEFSSLAISLRVVHVLENLFVHTNTRIQQHQQHRGDAGAHAENPLPPVARVALNEFTTPAVAVFLLQAFTETSGGASNGGIGAAGARLASAHRLVAGNALVHLLVYCPSLISKVFSTDTSLSTADSNGQRSVGGLGIYLDAILRTIEVVFDVSPATGSASTVVDGESSNASAKENSYAAKHSRKANSLEHPSSPHGGSSTPPVPITLTERDEGLVRCSLNLLQLLLSQIAVCGPNHEQKDAGNEGEVLQYVDFDDVSRYAVPTSLRKLRNSLLRRQHRLAAAVLGIFSPKVTQSSTNLSGESRAVVAPSETLRAKAALVLRQAILQLDGGLATVLEHICNASDLSFAGRLENMLRATLTIGQDEEEVLLHAPRKRLTIQSPFCKAAVCLLADAVAGILHSGLQFLQDAIVGTSPVARPKVQHDSQADSLAAPQTVMRRKMTILVKHVFPCTCLRRVVEDHFVVQHAAAQRLGALAAMTREARIRPLPPPLDRVLIGAVQQLAARLPGMVLSASAKLSDSSATTLGSVLDAVATWSLLVDAAQVVSAAEERVLDGEVDSKDDRTGCLSSVLLPALSRVAAVACGGVVMQEGQPAQQPLEELSQTTLHRIDILVRQRVSGFSSSFGESLARHVVPVASMVVASFTSALKKAASDAVDSKVARNRTAQENDGSGNPTRVQESLQESLRIIFSILKRTIAGPPAIIVPQLEVAKTFTESNGVNAVSPIRLVILCMISSGLMGDGLAFLMGWRDTRTAPVAAYLMYLCVSNLLTPARLIAPTTWSAAENKPGDTSTVTNIPWTKEQQDLVLSQATSGSCWRDLDMLKALACADSTAKGNGRGSAPVTCALLLRPPFQIVQHVANAFSVKIRNADSAAIQLLHCVLGAAIGFGSGLRMSYGLTLVGQTSSALGDGNRPAQWATHVASPVLRAALENYILPKHMDALLRILTLSTEVVTPRHLPLASAPDGTFTLTSTTYSCLATECLGVMALWFNGGTLRQTSQGSTPNFAGALLSTLAKPDKSCARFVSSISSCATIEERLKRQVKASSCSPTHARLLEQKARQVSVGVLLILNSALDAPAEVVRRWKPGLESNNFFSLCHRAITLVRPILLSRDTPIGNGRDADAVRQLLDGVVKALGRAQGVDGDSQQQGRGAMPQDDII